MTNEELAAIALARTICATCAIAEDGFEAEGECPECGYEGVMEFVAIDSETAVADCPECGWDARKYIGRD